MKKFTVNITTYQEESFREALKEVAGIDVISERGTNEIISFELGYEKEFSCFSLGFHFANFEQQKRKLL